MFFFPSDLHRKHTDHLLEHRKLTLSGTGNLNAKAYFLSELMKASDPAVLKKKKDALQTLVWVVEEASEAEKTVQNMRFWTHLPVYNYAIAEEGKLTDLQKMLRLYGALKDERKVIVIDPASLLAPYCSRADLEKKTISLKIGDTLDPMEIINEMLAIGYEFSADEYLMPGTYCKQGGVLNIYLPTLSSPIKIETDGFEISGIFEFDQESKQLARKHEQVDIVPLKFDREKAHFFDYFGHETVVVNDEVDLSPEFSQRMKDYEKEHSDAENPDFPAFIDFTAFPEEEDEHYFYLYYLSILKFQDVFDFLNDLKEKQKGGWKVVIFSKHLDELKALLSEEKLRYSTAQKTDESCFLHLEDAQQLSFIPQSFQNPELKVAVITDREIFDFRQIRRKVTKVQRKVNIEFLQSLKEADYVVHVDHGIGQFMGIDQQEFEGMKREYLKIQYAANDKLYVPIDQAEKVNKYVGIGNEEPRLTRLGSGEWNSVQSKVKKKLKRSQRNFYCCTPNERWQRAFHLCLMTK